MFRLRDSVTQSCNHRFLPLMVLNPNRSVSTVFVQRVRSRRRSHVGCVWGPGHKPTKHRAKPSVDLGRGQETPRAGVGSSRENRSNVQVNHAILQFPQPHDLRVLLKKERKKIGGSFIPAWRFSRAEHKGRSGRDHDATADRSRDQHLLMSYYNPGQPGTYPYGYTPAAYAQTPGSYASYSYPPTAVTGYGTTWPYYSYVPPQHRTTTTTAVPRSLATSSTTTSGANRGTSFATTHTPASYADTINAAGGSGNTRTAGLAAGSKRQANLKGLFTKERERVPDPQVDTIGQHF